MPEWIIFIFFLIAILATAISTVIGFGSALILISISSILFDVKWGIGITTVLYFFNTLNKTIQFNKSIDLSIALKVSILSIPGVIIGAFLMVASPEKYIYLLIAAISIIYLIFDLLGLARKFIISNPILYGSSFIYGFLSGIAGTGSIIKAVVFKQMKLKKEVFVATMAASALHLNLLKIGVFSYKSVIGIKDIPIMGGLLISSFIGVFLGKRLLSRISEKFFYVLVRFMLLGLSIRLIYSAMNNSV